MNLPLQAPAFVPPTMQHQAPAPAGLGELAFPTTGGIIVGLVIAGAGAYAGYKVGEKVGAPSHKTAGKVIGALAGWFIVPAIVGTVLMAVTPASAAPPPPPPAK